MALRWVAVAPCSAAPLSTVRLNILWVTLLPSYFEKFSRHFLLLLSFLVYLIFLRVDELMLGRPGLPFAITKALKALKVEIPLARKHRNDAVSIAVFLRNSPDQDLSHMGLFFESWRFLARSLESIGWCCPATATVPNELLKIMAFFQDLVGAEIVETANPSSKFMIFLSLLRPAGVSLPRTDVLMKYICILAMKADSNFSDSRKNKIPSFKSFSLSE